MKKSFKTLMTICLLLTTLSFNLPAGRSQSLTDQRENVIQTFMMGITESFAYEEVDAYISSEEAYILETGSSRSLSSYGINGNHSTGQAIILSEYLDNYFAANTSESQQTDLYPYAVDFSELPAQMQFYEFGGDGSLKFTLENLGDRINIQSNEFYPSFEGRTNQFTGTIQDGETQVMNVMTQSGDTRTVYINTQIPIGATTHRTDFIFYVFHNLNGGLSLLIWQQENPQTTLVEYATDLSHASPQVPADTYNALEHAPYLKDFYYYKDGGSPLEGGDNYREVTLQFPPDDNGLYQFVLEEMSFGEFSTVTYVYQITDQGIYEQAYFETNNLEMTDYRYHPDATNEYASLILPAGLYPGLSFNSGYSDQAKVEVVAVHDVFEFLDQTYEEVIELRYDGDTHLLLAPDIGIIGEAYYTADLGYNPVYYLESYRPSEDSTSPVADVTNDFPYAVALEDFGQVVRFYSPGTMNKNLVEFYPQDLLINVYYDDLRDGGYALAYSGPVQIAQVPTQEIQINRHLDLMSHYDVGDQVQVNTQITVLDPSLDEDGSQPFYLFYNTAGNLSLAYWNGTSWSGMSSGTYTEMIPQ